MKTKTLLCLIVVTTLLISPAWSIDQVSPRTGKVTITQTDNHLRTPAGPLPILRSFRSDLESGFLGPGWSLDIVSHLDRMGKNLLIITQADRPTLLVQKGDEKVFEGPGNVRAQLKKDQWIVESPANVTSIYDMQGREISRHDANGNTVSFTYDKEGRLSEIQAVKGHPLRIRYGDNGLLSSIQDATSRQSTYRYDTAGRLVEAQDANGWKTTYRYAENGRLSEVNYPSGVKVSFRYDKSGRVSKRVSSSGITYTYSYGKATRITRQDGFWWETEYNEKNLPVKYLDSLKRGQIWSWNDQGQLLERRFLDGSSAIYAYDQQGRLIKQETSRGDILRITYDSASSRPAKIDLNSAETRFTYDKNGNPLSVISPAGRKTTYQYDQQGRRISMTDGEGITTRFDYDSLGNMVKQTNPDNGVISWQYDKNGQVSRKLDPLGNVTTYAYQSNGLLDSITLPGGERISWQYDGHGRLIEETIRGLATRFSYDKRGFLVRIDYPDETCEEIAYNAMGNPVNVTDVLGRVTRQEFDSLGRLIKTTAPSGVVLSNTFSSAGKMESITIGQSKILIASDDGGKVVRLTDPSGGVIHLVKDRWGRVIQRAFPGGGQEQRQYDPDGFLQAVTLPMGDTWSFRHNGAGQLQKLIFPDGGIQKLAYDAAGRIASIIYPSGKKVSYRYNPAGLLLESTNARSQKVQYQYDKSGRLISKQTPEDVWNYRYDARENLVQAGNGKFTVRYSYDRLGLLMQTEYPQWGKTVKYEYDKFGRVAARTDPDGNRTHYIYDKLGKVSRIEGPRGNIFTFSYDQTGRLAQKKAANGTTTEYGYDESGRIVSIAHADPSGEVLTAREYSYDVDSNRVEVVDEKGKKSIYRYDQEQRLIGETGLLGRRAYVYGPGGKRSSVTGQSGAAAYRYDQAGRLVQAGEVSFSYDADGNLVSRKNKDGATRYFYDSENDLVKVELPGGKTIAYGYGPFGERIWRDEDGSRTYYLLDGDDLLQELSANFKPLSIYVHAALDRPLMVSSGDGETGFFHQDDLGSVLAISDGKGKVSARYSYDAFGNVMKQEGDDANQPLRFTGRPLDKATGLYDLRARFYDPQAGRFISRDPVFGEIHDPVTLSPYLYVRNNPLSYVDPFGLQADRSIIPVSAPTKVISPHAGLRNLYPMTGERVPYPNLPSNVIGRMKPGNLTRVMPGPVHPSTAPTVMNVSLGGPRMGAGSPTTATALPGTPTRPMPIGQGGTRVVTPGAQRPGTPTVQIQPGGWQQSLTQTAGEIGGAAALGNAILMLGDIAAAGLSNPDNALEAMVQAAWNTALSVGIGMTAGVLAATAAATVAGSTAVAVVAVGGAVIGTGAVGWGSGQRIGAAYQEGQAWKNAVKEEAYNQSQADRIRKKMCEIIDSIEKKIAEIKGDLSELEKLELEVANRRNHATAQEDRAKNLRDKVQRLKNDKIVALARLYNKITYGKDRKRKIDENKAKSSLTEIEDLARQACDHVNDNDGSQKTRELKSEAETKAREFKVNISPDWLNFYAARAMAKEIADAAQSCIIDAEELEKDVNSDLRGIDERITLMKGQVENWQAKKLRKEVLSSLNRLKLFGGGIANDAAALRAKLDAITLPDGNKATSLLAAAQQSRVDVERFVEKFRFHLDIEDSQRCKTTAESVAKTLKDMKQRVDSWIERADSAVAKARDCADKSKKTLAKVIVVPGTVTLSIGDSESFTAMAKYADGSIAPITPSNWADSQKEFTATTAGTHTITATYQGISGSATIIVKSTGKSSAPGAPTDETTEPGPTEPGAGASEGQLILSGMQISPAAVRINVGGSASFVATPIDINGMPVTGADLQQLSFEWIVNDPSVANIFGSFNTATITPFKEGQVVVICTTAQAMATAAVTIVRRPSSSEIIDRFIQKEGQRNQLTGRPDEYIKDQYGHGSSDTQMTYEQMMAGIRQMSEEMSATVGEGRRHPPSSGEKGPASGGGGVSKPPSTGGKPPTSGTGTTKPPATGGKPPAEEEFKLPAHYSGTLSINIPGNSSSDHPVTLVLENKTVGPQNLKKYGYNLIVTYGFRVVFDKKKKVWVAEKSPAVKHYGYHKKDKSVSILILGMKGYYTNITLNGKGECKVSGKMRNYTVKYQLKLKRVKR